MWLETTNNIVIVGRAGRHEKATFPVMLYSLCLCIQGSITAFPAASALHQASYFTFRVVIFKGGEPGQKAFLRLFFQFYGGVTPNLLHVKQGIRLLH